MYSKHPSLGILQEGFSPQCWTPKRTHIKKEPNAKHTMKIDINKLWIQNTWAAYKRDKKTDLGWLSWVNLHEWRKRPCWPHVPTASTFQSVQRIDDCRRQATCEPGIIVMTHSRHHHHHHHHHQQQQHHSSSFIILHIHHHRASSTPNMNQAWQILKMFFSSGHVKYLPNNKG